MILLSYPLNINTPAYGNGTSFQRIQEKRIFTGDSCNTLQLTVSNHLGTHVDCPYHFYETGLKVTDYPNEFWVCSNVQVLRQKLSPGELFNGNHLKDALKRSTKNPNAEMVILITGWYKRRNQEIYWKTPPGIAPETAGLLRSQFPFIRFLGFDLISLSSFTHRDLGRIAHKQYLSGDHPILPIEDMNLSLITDEDIGKVLISPLFVLDADAAPCTIWGKI